MQSTQGSRGESAPQWTADQVMFTLAYLAYDGESSTDPQVVMQELTTDLANVTPLQGQWQLMWGPTLFRLPLAELDDNMWYVVRNTGTGEYAIGVRGTNFDAILDWIVEDFWITSEVPWPYRDIEGAKPRISDGTAFAINKLLTVTPNAGIPGAGLTLPQFLTMQAMPRPITVAVTGHSLGGCLSSTLALALKDTVTHWSPKHTPNVRSWSFAGPTAGNTDFARYTDEQIGDALHRWVNILDVAPLAWNESTLDDAVTIYASHGLLPSWAELAALGLAKALAAGGDYRQPSQGTVTRSGDFNISPGYQSYAAQADWQHTQGYAAILGLSNVLPRKTSAPTAERVVARLAAMRRRALV
jgi:hypothetical protein